IYYKEWLMTPQEKETEMMKSQITKELRLLFKANMKIFDWDIPENDDRQSAELIIDVIQKALDELKSEVKEGKYDEY
ncbi:hypothetical protein, partial [Sulfurovum sp.]